MDALAIAMKEFKKEQENRKVEDIKTQFRQIVNEFGKIKKINAEISELFGKLGYEIDDDFRDFLKNVKNYDELVFISIDGNVGIGSKQPGSELFLFGENGKRVKT